MSRYEQQLEHLWSGIRALSKSDSIEQRLRSAQRELSAAYMHFTRYKDNTEKLTEQYIELIEAFVIDGGLGPEDSDLIKGELTDDSFDKIADMYLSLYYDLRNAA